jgi:phosphoribosylaminoimidazolecarboxamide formyltransferase/IMP cyclohydrolase
LRYGENPHQQAGVYTALTGDRGAVIGARQLQGKPLSFNNIADADAAMECALTLDPTACVIVKHANPCGVAIAATALEAYGKAYSTDPKSAFGGVISFNGTVDGPTAASMIDQQFIEVIIAPSFDESAVEALRGKPNIRILESGNLPQTPSWDLELHQITGGMLLQDRDLASVSRSELTVVSERAPTDQEVTDALLAWNVAKFVKSNAIVYCRDGATLGIGAGQTSRVMSAQIAALKAAEGGLELRGAAMASDAFFPFRDGIDTGATHGVGVIIQPGGSVNDEEVIAAANEHGIAMLFTGMRHFRH